MNTKLTAKTAKELIEWVLNQTIPPEYTFGGFRVNGYELSTEESKRPEFSYFNLYKEAIENFPQVLVLQKDNKTYILVRL